jgi:hypothetical protein
MVHESISELQNNPVVDVHEEAVPQVHGTTFAMVPFVTGHGSPRTLTIITDTKNMVIIRSGIIKGGGRTLEIF